MNNNEEFYKAVKLAFIVLIIFTFIGLVEKIRQNLQPTDSSAIFGGQLENGYDFVGYVVADKGNGNLEICGTAFLNENTTITAAHCVDDNVSVYVGLGQFSANRNDYYEVTNINIHPNWANGNNISSDIAILTTKKSVFLSQYAQISSADISCDYKVVGYGKQDNTDNYYPLRKSADLCIESTDFNDGSISFVGKTGGLCFGDSGSPIFKTGTNQIVTVASRIDACYTNNFGTGSDLTEQYSKIVAEVINTPQTLINACGSIDSNNDNVLNLEDLNDFTKFYGQKCEDIDFNYKCGKKDGDNDGDIDLIDFSNFAKKYISGKCE